MRIVYKVFSKITGIFAGRIGKSTFKSVWSRIDDEDPPKPTRLDASLSKVVAGAALEATTMAVITTIVERATASTFSYLFGVNPEPPPKEKKKQD
jgi:uncharacterized protein DUF4235